MPSVGELIAAEALTWIDTPFVWGQATKGRGCDCKGLVTGVAAELGRREGSNPIWTARDYGAGKFTTNRLIAGLKVELDKVATAHVGDVLVIVLDGAPQHLGICVAVEDGRPREMVHCYAGGIARVRRTPLAGGHRVHSIWRWRD